MYNKELINMKKIKRFLKFCCWKDKTLKVSIRNKEFYKINTFCEVRLNFSQIFEKSFI